MKRQYFYLSVILSILIFAPLVFADGGGVIWPPRVHLDQTAQNAIVAWNGEEEIIILSNNIKSDSKATFLRIVPLPSNPTEIEEADPNCFEKLVELLNEKLKTVRPGPPPPGPGPAPPGGIEIIFHQKIGAHDVTVVKVNNSDYFVNWIKSFAQDKGLEVKEISKTFRDGVDNYLKRRIEYFVFDVIEPEAGEETIKPLIYRFDCDCLYYPLLISGISEISESWAKINLFLITPMQAVLSDPPYSYYRYHWFYSYGFPVGFTEEELQQVSEDLRDLFEGPVKARRAYLYDKLNQLTRDLSLYPSHFWNKDLTLGSSGEEVKALQKILINEGVWDSDQKANGYFGLVTKNALAKFQEKYLGFSSGTGYFDRETREYFKQLSIKLWGQIIYVDADANGANDGSSWSHAYNCLQDALATASILDEIRLAEGIYKPAGPSGARTATFQLKNGVAIKGGYAGFGEPDPNARDIEVYETVLSGDLYGDDGPDFANNDENSYHVITGSRTNETVVLDGFTITGGNANGSYPYGGGICNYFSSLTLANCSFNGNSAVGGGGMFNWSGSPTLSKCTFSDNSANYGGGMNNYESNPVLTNCTFSHNNSTDGSGGGMSNTDSSPTLTNCTFSGNRAYDDGGGICNYFSSPTLTDCTFSGNSAGWSGGGMNNYESNPVLTNCTFSENSAKYGGGIANIRSAPVLTNCTFSHNNSTDGSGGGMSNTDSSPTLTNCTFSGNRAYDDGGGICNYFSSPTLTNCTLSGNSAKYEGGGIFYFRTSTTLTNCTFAGNAAPNGNTLACDSYVHSYPSNVELTNCILWDGSDEIYNRDDSTVNITYSDVQGGYSGEDNINADPCFVDLGYWDADGVCVDGDYHLLPDSPCIDAGDPNYIAEPNETDLDGKPRVMGGRIDMGAYESIPLVAEVRIVPRTINLTSKGNWMTCYIWLPEDYDVADIDPNSIFLNLKIQAETVQLNEQQQIAVVRFYRPEVRGILCIGEVELTISVLLTNGTIFEGRDVIQVVNKEGGGKPAKYGKASNPNPADGATGVDINADLSWTPDRHATSHDVYFGTSSPPPFVCNQADTAFDPGMMDSGRTYYWRIDEVNKWGITTGKLWSFTTIEGGVFPPPPPP